MLTLECQVRPQGSKPNALRRSGWIPAVLYGHNGTESLSLVVKAKTAELLVRDAKLNKTPIQVQISDNTWSGQVVLQEVQAHPWKTLQIYHLSFMVAKDAATAA
uniref:Ribosomal protein L25 n=1 Tax=Cyanothece sp. (strain PCC 7425 / ATCC 29141) TaxID=395961 RepID=B8HY85_CYAP4